MPNRPTWVKSYPDRWLSGETRLSMSLAERGAFRDLFDHASVHGSIPSDPALLTRILGTDENEFETIWPRVSKKFKNSKDGRLMNEGATKVRNEACKFMKKQAENARKGGRPKKKPPETQVKPMGLPTAKPWQSERATHSKHRHTEKQTIVGRKQTEKDSSERAAEGNGGLELVEPSEFQAQFHNDRRLDNGFYQPTMNDAEELCRVMFEATRKAEPVETAWDWLRLAKRAKSWSHVRQVLKGKLSNPRNKPQNNAWFRKVLENEFGLSPDSRKSLQAELKSRYQDAIRNHEPGKPNLKAQRLLEEAVRSGIPQSVLLWSI